MKRKILAVLIAAAAIAITACSEVKENALPEAAATTENVSQDETESEEKQTEESTEDIKSGSAKTDEQTSEAVSGNGEKISVKYPDTDLAKKTDEAISASKDITYTRTRATDKKSGDVVDTSIYKDKKGNIIKVITEDHGSDGLICTEYYFNSDQVVYIKQSKSDIYGTGASYTEADMTDPEAKYTKGYIEAADTILKSAKADKGKVTLYGYVGDEQGGITKNATVSLRNVAGDVTAETTTNGDGYYTFELPQTEDTYNLSYTYGDNLVSTLNDVHIIPGTPEYSLGKVYVAPAGYAVHDTDTYLLNANLKSPVSLKDGEYAVVLTSEDTAMTMKLVNTEDQSNKSGNQITFDPAKSKSGYRLFVEDGGNIGKDDMSGNMGKTNVTVTIYDKNGIKAAYREPVGRLGTLWSVCDVNNAGDIAISGIMYTDTKGWK
ncbi:MAG: carboxypeptidase-like regulatory domain-containing protein [Lachnospiraceae bacterium]|nr:carboxypeptidase-like regulatory domain-containing protein [Lachnospiraceae bacterium]